MALRLKWLVVSFCFFQFLPYAVAKNEQQTSPEFKKEFIQLGQKKILVEIAETNQQLEYGLMHRTSLKEDQGMLFIFKDEQILSFWMKNTLIDLSIGYFSGKKVLNEVIEMKSTSFLETNFPSYPSQQPAMYALEMNKGWFNKNKIKTKAAFKFLDRKNESRSGL